MSFSERLKKERLNKNLSQESLGEILDVSRQTITKWEAGETYPDIENLVKLSAKLEVSLDHLLVDEIKMKGGNTSALTLEANQILDSAVSNSIADSELLLDYVDSNNTFSDLKTGFKCIDDILGDFCQNPIYLLSGPSQIGKTTFALSIANNVSRIGKVIWYTNTDTKKELYARLLASESGIPTSKSCIGGYSQKKREKLKAVVQSVISKNIEIREAYNIDFKTLSAELLTGNEKTSLIIIDEIKDFEITNGHASYLKLLDIARYNECPIIAIDHWHKEEYSLEADLVLEWLSKQYGVTTLLMNRKDYYDIKHRRNAHRTLCDFVEYNCEKKVLGRGQLFLNQELCKFEEVPELF